MTLERFRELCYLNLNCRPYTDLVLIYNERWPVIHHRAHKIGRTGKCRDFAEVYDLQNITDKQVMNGVGFLKRIRGVKDSGALLMCRKAIREKTRRNHMNFTWKLIQEPLEPEPIMEPDDFSDADSV
jgi:hypothetical protein